MQIVLSHIRYYRTTAFGRAPPADDEVVALDGIDLKLKGRFNVDDVYGELRAPLLANRPFFDRQATTYCSTIATSAPA